LVLATGAVPVRPNVDLARDAGLTLGETGAIKVDGEMRTSDPDIYAGGDCVEAMHLLLKRPVVFMDGGVIHWPFELEHGKKYQK
jgi:NADPH-dependent 2,4-dienoyl-CoA reductase/sulfur reductase-like enzyme